MKLLLCLTLLLSLSGCIRYEEWLLTKAQRHITEEQALIIRDYRQCLQAHAQDDSGQACAVYNQALLQLQIKDQRH